MPATFFYGPRPDPSPSRHWLPVGGMGWDRADEVTAAPVPPVLGQRNRPPASTSGERLQMEISAEASLAGEVFILSSRGDTPLQMSDANHPAAATLVAGQGLSASWWPASACTSRPCKG